MKLHLSQAFLMFQLLQGVNQEKELHGGFQQMNASSGG